MFWCCNLGLLLNNYLDFEGHEWFPQTGFVPLLSGMGSFAKEVYSLADKGNGFLGGFVPSLYQFLLQEAEGVVWPTCLFMLHFNILAKMLMLQKANVAGFGFLRATSLSTPFLNGVGKKILGHKECINLLWVQWLLVF
ncbi:hypothetical protein ACSQ67_024264 [Phaseolus vulgaris]